ncbi:hypothetical protein GKE82_11860 [Conexibacter sp. W3-3-2]|uniref:endonuclease/exonuclease/phosphatase family protein n=1 Tax=Conexibacter sp. W3-3-2 TaxID=2675227 RepID=UPI0012B6D511|nr:endonuclease/exonuclease/phosphatase family protein [Conexibacter sp. W3-3-2]MTD44965.1 hypothetical protein [Conexibacter sp. W3-3-2]
MTAPARPLTPPGRTPTRATRSGQAGRMLRRGALAVVALGLAAPTVGSVAPASASTSVRVMTFNIAQLRVEDSRDRIVRLIRFYDPQVVFLNEVDGPNDQRNQAHSLAAALGMQAQTYLTERHGSVLRGNAILIPKRLRFLRVSRSRLTPNGCYLRGVVGATVDLGAANVNLGVAHLDGKEAGASCSNDPGYPVTSADAALEQAKQLRRIVGKPSCATFVGGDMNRVPGSSTHRVLTTFLKDTWLQRFDGRPVHRGGNQYTYGWATGGTPAKRIDYLLYDNATPMNADVPDDGLRVPGGEPDDYGAGTFPSDHKPVIASYRIPAARSCPAG